MAQGGSFTCPVDGDRLKPMERQGIEIDYCPSCRGVWLDRGELDKIVERSAVPTMPMPDPSARHDDPYRPHGHKPAAPRRRKSFLEELFD